jgi:hypothetical protein
MVVMASVAWFVMAARYWAAAGPNLARDLAAFSLLRMASKAGSPATEPVC